LRKSEDPTERKAGEGLEERRTSAGKTRSKFENAPEELQARIDAGEAELTPSGKEVVTKDGVKIGRVNNGKLKATEATVTKDRGGLSKSYGGRKRVGLSEEQAQRQAELAEKTSKYFPSNLPRHCQVQTECRTWRPTLREQNLL